MILQVCAVGLVAGTHAATWGAYKDTPFEGFSPLSFLRSIAVAVGLALVTGLLLGVHTAATSVVLVFAVVYGLERLATEWWKAFLREDDQSAYSIPMRFAVRGRVVDARRPRYLGAAVVAGGLPLTCWLLWLAQGALPHLPTWVVVTCIGPLGGWATAVGGAWKDAPVEGFSGAKFLRSPAVATAWAALLSLVTSSWVALVLGAAGMAVASIETYKTFLTGGRPPGKFDGRPVRHSAPRLRRTAAWVHAALWLLLAAWSAHAVLFLAGAVLAAAVVVCAGVRPARPSPGPPHDVDAPGDAGGSPTGDDVRSPEPV